MSASDIKEEFVRCRIAGEAISLKQLATKYGRSHQGLRKAASRGQWSQAAAMACAQRDAAVAEQVESEVEVRERHARLGRSLQGVAIERLMTLDPGALSAKLALDLLRTAIEVERVALGLTDAPSQRSDDDSSGSHIRDAVATAVEILDRHRLHTITPGSGASLQSVAVGGSPRRVSPLDRVPLTKKTPSLPSFGEFGEPLPHHTDRGPLPRAFGRRCS